MRPLELGWIDYSSEHRNKVMAVLDLLSAKEAIDELGIGLIRDGFADVLFPGTSTIQTRAKYFFIVPYLLMELEKENHASPKEFLNVLGEREVALIDTLNEPGANGVIGARSGRKLKRKPSNIYWSGLRTFEIFKYDHLSLANYAKAVIAKNNNKRNLRSLGNEERDDADASREEYVGTFWQSIFPEINWKESVSLELTHQEANFLKERILKAEKSKNSLFAFLLNEDMHEVEKIDDFDAIGEAFSLPSTLKNDYLLAKRFSAFITGANIRYNIIISNGENKLAMDRWDKWINSSFVQNKFGAFPYQQVMERLKIKNGRLYKFLDDWQKAVLSNNEQLIDELIIKREIELKTKERAKLMNSKLYSYKEGDWVGIDKLEYRFSDAKVLMDDIFTALEGHDA